jgi:hypothetical protein
MVHEVPAHPAIYHPVPWVNGEQIAGVKDVESTTTWPPPVHALEAVPVVAPQVAGKLDHKIKWLSSNIKRRHKPGLAERRVAGGARRNSGRALQGWSARVAGAAGAAATRRRRARLAGAAADVSDSGACMEE